MRKLKYDEFIKKELFGIPSFLWAEAFEIMKRTPFLYIPPAWNHKKLALKHEQKKFDAF